MDIEYTPCPICGDKIAGAVRGERHIECASFALIADILRK